MTEGGRIGEAVIHRALDRDRVLSLAEGDFAPIFLAYEEHIRRWELPVTDVSRARMQEGLAALGLHLSTRPAGETVGLTVNIRQPPLNLFLTGDAGERTLTGRSFSEDVQTGPSNRLFVQTFRPRTGVQLSAMDVDGTSVLRMFEEYYERSEQFPARLVALGGTRYGLVQALPDGGRERVAALTPESTAALFATEHDALEEKTLRFRCGCNPEKIIGALRQIFAAREEELFRDDPGVEAYCPRCGARWWIERTAYDAAAEDE
jgi:hypothetical protein